VSDSLTASANRDKPQGWLLPLLPPATFLKPAILIAIRQESTTKWLRSADNLALLAFFSTFRALYPFFSEKSAEISV